MFIPKFFSCFDQSLSLFSASGRQFSIFYHYSFLIVQILYDWNHVPSMIPLLASPAQNDVLKFIHVYAWMSRKCSAMFHYIVRHHGLLSSSEMSVCLNCSHLGMCIMNKDAMSISHRVRKRVCISLFTRRKVSRLESEIPLVWTTPWALKAIALLCPSPLKRSQMGD